MKRIENNTKDQQRRVPTPSCVSANRANSFRYTVDLTPAAHDELENIKRVLNMNAAQVFRSALLLARIYTKAIMEEKEVQIVDPKTPNRVKVIELAMLSTQS